MTGISTGLTRCYLGYFISAELDCHGRPDASLSPHLMMSIPLMLILASILLGGLMEVESFQFVKHLSFRSSSRNQLAATLKYPLTQVVSDIDDTLKSSGGVKIGGVALGGIDVQYSRGEFYPGVFQFMWELSLYSVKLNQRYCDDREKSDDGSFLSKLAPPKVAVLTAVSTVILQLLLNRLICCINRYFVMPSLHIFSAQKS
jgi:hypothetical protein